MVQEPFGNPGDHHESNLWLTSKHLQKQMRKILNHLKSDWYKYALELIVITAGILGAFALNNWNESKQEEKRIKVALRAVHSDMVQDSLFITEELVYVKEIGAHSEALLHKVYESTSNLDTLIKVMKEDFYFRWWTYFEFNKNAFDYIKSSGTFDLLPDEIRSALSEYYTISEANVRDIEALNDQYRTSFHEFVHTYNIVGRLHDPNYANSYLYNGTWVNLDPQHFLPLVATVIPGHSILYYNAEYSLEKAQKSLRKTTTLLDDYLSQ